MTSIFVLVFLTWVKVAGSTQSAPHYINGQFPDRFNCLVAYGEMVGTLHKDKKVTGFSVVGEPCDEAKEAFSL